MPEATPCPALAAGEPCPALSAGGACAAPDYVAARVHDGLARVALPEPLHPTDIGVSLSCAVDRDLHIDLTAPGLRGPHGHAAAVRTLARLCDGALAASKIEIAVHDA